MPSTERPQWVERNDPESGPYFVVPAELTPDQRIFDQPPYVFLQVDLQLDFFEDFEVLRNRSKNAFFRFLSKNFLTGSETEQLDDVFALYLNCLLYNDFTDGAKVMSDKYKHSAMSIMNSHAVFLSTYPYAFDYLNNVWTRDRFNSLGAPKSGGFQIPPPLSYVAWRTLTEQKVKMSKWHGLADILPRLSTAEDVVDALPAKGEPNILFRLYRSGALAFEPNS